MKKLLSLIFVFALATQMVFSFSGSGAGSVGDPYQITNVSQLQEMKNSLGSHYVLMNDIDASATSGWNSGSGYQSPYSFSGSLNGNGFTISNLYINASSYVGLFGYAVNAEIYDLTLSDVDFSGSNYIGGIVGRAINVDITDCHVSGSIYGPSDFIGGVIGYLLNSSTVSNCSSSADVQGVNDNIGGFVGRTHISDIINCSSTGNVSSDDFTGGFVGYNSNTDIIKCFSTGDVSGGHSVGGFCGYNTSSSSITDCYSWSKVDGNEFGVGGFIGRSSTSTADNCYSIGDVDGSSQVGGFCGVNYSSPSTITSCYWDTQTSGMGTSAGGTGKTTTEMKQQATFSGWDFTDVWVILEDSSYPLFGDSIPTLTEWAAIFMGILLAGFGVFFIFRRMA